MCILNTNACMIRMSVIFFSRHAFCNTFSTHDLSGRSTIGDVSSIHIALFSTHDLSGRSTISRYIRRTHWFFQLTTSRGGRRLDLKLIYRFYLFNSRPLGEVDTQYHLLPGLMLFFNSRPLGEVDYIALSKNYTAVIFQLTTSRGGRRIFPLF